MWMLGWRLNLRSIKWKLYYNSGTFIYSTFLFRCDNELPPARARSGALDVVALARTSR